MIIISELIAKKEIGDIFKHIGEGFGLGLWVTIVTSLVLAVYNPRR